MDTQADEVGERSFVPQDGDHAGTTGIALPPNLDSAHEAHFERA